MMKRKTLKSAIGHRELYWFKLVYFQNYITCTKLVTKFLYCDYGNGSLAILYSNNKLYTHLKILKARMVLVDNKFHSRSLD
jgi:hypothetical protein